MSLAQVASRALLGMEAPPVTVEVHLSPGLPGFTIVGLPEAEVREARDRVRSALINSGLGFPSNKRIVVNLAPADLPKESGRFDLPIAIGLLAAQGLIPPQRLQGHTFAGELSLTGELRPTRGALAMACALAPQQADAVDAQAGPRLVLPLASAEEAALAQAATVLGARDLQQVVAYLLEQDGAAQRVTSAVTETRTPVGPDMAEVRGHSAAKRALEIAAAGGHHALMVGPPGSGKSMLAQRFVSLLPPLTRAQALESATVLSLVGRFDPVHWGRRIMRSPHHTASAVALVGGGAGTIRPGEISLATQNVLFLDELPEFDRAVLDSLREPLETGRIHISRAARQAEFPAQFQLIAAMNPCPCGYLGHPTRACRCTPDQVARYQGRISGPLLDRIDIQVEVGAIAPETLLQLPQGETSAQIAARVAAAAAVQLARQGGLNAGLQGAALDAHCALDAAGSAFLTQAISRLGWSSRAAHRVLRLARTIADLAQAQTIALPHLAEAMQLRRALAAQ